MVECRVATTRQPHSERSRFKRTYTEDGTESNEIVSNNGRIIAATIIPPAGGPAWTVAATAQRLARSTTPNSDDPCRTLRRTFPVHVHPLVLVSRTAGVPILRRWHLRQLSTQWRLRVSDERRTNWTIESTIAVFAPIAQFHPS